MSSPPSRYADWKAPDEDGQILIWPDPGTLARETSENRHRLANCRAMVQRVPLNDLRRRQREWIGHGVDDMPLIATGHQTELYHCGVWAKDVLINAVARKVGGRAWHFAVDTDSPKHLHLRWPGGSMPITDDPRLTSAAWTGLLDGPTPGHLAELEGAFNEARLGWDFEPMVEGFLANMKRQAMEQTKLASGLTSAMHQLDGELGLGHDVLLMAPVWGSEPYLVFAHHLLARAGEFAGQYNAALAGYRREQGISSPGRPMPDLAVGTEEVETPFWLDDLENESRGRLVLKKVHGGCGLMDSRAGGEALFVFEEGKHGEQAATELLACLRRHRLRIAPRALTLTMFFRLLLADQFVHGIGGGRYDQVTDRLIAEHFGIEPPRFAVTTATLYFPAARGQRRVSLRPLLQEGRRLRHGSFWREKRDLAERIATLPRRSRERSELFYQMHARLAQQAASPRMREWSARLDEATRAQVRQRTLFDRELFYAIQPEERLRGLIERYDAVVNGS
jgi:hypothetical protein